MSMKKIFTALLVGIMVAFAVSFTASAAGSIIGYTSEAGIWGECGGPASKSFELKVYSGNTLIGTSTLNNVDGIIDGDVYVTWHLQFVDDEDEYWTYTWEPGHPRIDYKPDTLKLYCDGNLYSEGPVKMHGQDGLWPVAWEEIESVGYAAKVDDVKYGTIKAAINAVLAMENGGTINLAAGEITEDITLPSVCNNITFKGAEGYKTVLKNSSVGHSGGHTSSMKNITFDGIDFDGSKINLTAIYENTKIENMTINNCKFHDITGNAAVLINTNALPNLVGFTFTGNTIENVSGGSFSGLVLRAAPAGDIVISNNTISNVAWNAVQIVNAVADADITITGNTFSAGADEGVLNIYGAKCGVTLANNNITTTGKQTEIANFDSIKVGTKYYGDIATAIGAANDGDTITLTSDATLESANIKKEITIDLAGYTLTVNAKGIMDSDSGANAAIQTWKNVTIKNGDVVANCAAPINNGIFYVATTGNLTFENVNFTVGESDEAALAAADGSTIFVICEPGTLEIIGSEITASGIGKLFEGAGNGKVVMENSEINVADSDRVLVNINIDATNSSFDISNISDNAFRNLSGTLNNTNINANGYKNGIKNDTGLALNVTGNSEITLTGGTASDLALAEGANLNVEETATFEADNTDIADSNDITGNVASKAEKVYVQFKKTDVDANGKDTVEGSDEYEIVLVGGDDEKINELASADLTFTFVGTPVNGGAMAYYVAPKAGVTLSQIGDRYMFNYDGVTKYEESGTAIVIGTITIEGYGAYTLATAEVTTNAVYATEIRDNIVDGFENAATLIINADYDEDDDMVGKITAGLIAVPTRELTINITFPNAINPNAAAYQDMKVEITGNIEGENKTVTYNLGETMVNGAYVVTEDKLVLNDAYTVTVSGAGYRTTRYTVTMTDKKTINFWNNVKDNETAIEAGKKTAKTTFLAGDIVKDGNINIYDLSAVVSYFGEINLNTSGAYNAYAKYDLNRDGKIDSKDVAYVLVSWNN